MTRPSREAEKWAVVVETLAGAEGLDPGALGSTLRSAGDALPRHVMVRVQLRLMAACLAEGEPGDAAARLDAATRALAAVDADAAARWAAQAGRLRDSILALRAAGGRGAGRAGAGPRPVPADVAARARELVAGVDACLPPSALDVFLDLRDGKCAGRRAGTAAAAAAGAGAAAASPTRAAAYTAAASPARLPALPEDPPLEPRPLLPRAAGGGRTVGWDEPPTAQPDRPATALAAAAAHPTPDPGSGSKRRKRVRWTEEEVECLIRLEAEERAACGGSPGYDLWARVRRRGTDVFQPGRTNVDLKDKWRNLGFKGLVARDREAGVGGALDLQPTTDGGGQRWQGRVTRRGAGVGRGAGVEC